MTAPMTPHERAAEALANKLAKYAVNLFHDDSGYGDVGHTLRKAASTLRAIAAAVAEEREAKWQPIETATRDGTLILAFIPSDGEIVFARWDTDCLDVDDEGWLQDIGERAWPLDVDPTYWQPLPGPPAIRARSTP
jgi:hypothetical protein